MPMKKVCPRCGATFDCMHNDILWVSGFSWLVSFLLSV